MPKIGNYRGAEEIFGVAAGSDRFGGEISEPSLTVDSVRGTAV